MICQRSFLRDTSSSPVLLLLVLSLFTSSSLKYPQASKTAPTNHSSSSSSAYSSYLEPYTKSSSRRELRESSPKEEATSASSNDDDDSSPPPAITPFEPCDVELVDYSPCQDPKRSLRFPRKNLVYRERHCPEPDEQIRCLIPPPVGYKYPLPWPKSRDEAWYVNVPYKHLTVEKAVQNWIRYDESTEKFIFPGGGTMFAKGADAYISDLAKLIPLDDGSIRTALDTGCGVASFGGYLLSRDVVTLSFAPRDTHEAQVQFALERGIPAFIAVLATMRLPFPGRAFDLAHCSRCLIPWAKDDGKYLTEIDRVLRPGGYWVLSGPPISYKDYYKGWKRSLEDLKAEQDAIEALAESMCWEKVVEEGIFAVWQKPLSNDCARRRPKSAIPPLCTIGSDPDQAWYTPMKKCISRLPEHVDENGVAGGKLAKWPQRMTAVPPRIRAESIAQVTEDKYFSDQKRWKKRIKFYREKLPLLAQGKYRNIMDMNAELGGFASSLKDDPVWVMNVVPVSNPKDTLGVIFERGFIGVYQNWCEAFSTYPRTYDFLHVHELFSVMDEKCPLEIVLLEMDRILRPEGAVIIRDDVEILVKVKEIAIAMRWDARIENSESSKDKILICVKKYWAAG